MKIRPGRNSGYTLPEITMASALMIISLGVILNTYLYSQRYFQAGTAQIIAAANARKAFRRMSNDIRKAQLVTIYNNYGTSPVAGTTGNYIEIDFPTGNDVGYYLNANNEIKYVPNLTADNKGSQSDDTLIADHIYGSNIFLDISGVISMAFSGFSTCKGPGYHATDIGTYVKPRN